MPLCGPRTKRPVRRVVTALVIAVTLSSTPVGASGWHYPAKYRTSGIGVRYPSPSDPSRTLSNALQTIFACIRYHESRNHLVDGYGSQGWYQFTLGTWQAARRFIPGLPLTPNQASGNQQSTVAIFYFKRNGRFGVEWAADSECFPKRLD